LANQNNKNMVLHQKRWLMERNKMMTLQ